MLTTEAAEYMVRQTMAKLRRNINIMDRDGVILASGDSSRVGERHEGAAEVVRTGEAVSVDGDQATVWRGSRIGRNLPLSLNGRVIGVVGVTGEPSELAELGELVQMTCELFLQQMLMKSGKEWRLRLGGEVMEAIAAGRWEADSVQVQLAVLQISLKAPYQLLDIELAPHSLTEKELLALLLMQQEEGAALLRLEHARRIRLLYSGLTEQQAERRLRQFGETLAHSGVTYRIGRSAAERGEDLAVAMREAALAVPYAASPGETAVYGGLAPQILLGQTDEELGHRYVGRTLAALNTTLLDTLQAFFDCNRSLQDTATVLFIHRNTLVYRLGKIKEKTGYDPHLFHDAFALQAALWMGRSKRKTE